ncbi:heme-binding domain-containing protein [Ferruginibacter yonginensis]|uniref:Heme-binding domain-containing protein n=1 Tax=Ferruginibacter yonginensis TaxID=1310416 RepID=A0ABV8QPA6_9BACT
MKKFFKYFIWILVIGFIIIQFFQPKQNKSDVVAVNDIATKYAVPADVMATLKTSCYDCHSNNTKYPWYSKIQPGAWFLSDHVNEGKRELNFNEFASYRIGRQYRKLEEIGNEIDDEMPLASYTFIHRDAVLTPEQKSAIKNWVIATRDSIKAHYPEDSLKRKAPPKPVAVK